MILTAARTVNTLPRVTASQNSITMDGDTVDSVVNRSQLGAYAIRVFCAGDAEPSVFRLKDEVVLGRGTAEQLPSGRLRDPQVSTRHATIMRSTDGWTITDNSSRNGTYVRGRRLAADLPTPLSSGDIIRVGQSLVVFRRGELPAFGDDVSVLPGLAPGVVTARRQIKALRSLDVPVLVVGETGTGKERVARAFHRGDESESLVVVNCGMLSKSHSRAELFGHEEGAYTGATQSRLGLIGKAEGGTLFLDEIGELALDVQVELLRFIQFGEYRPLGADKAKRGSCRIVAATNVALEKAVEQGRFRSDLLGRLKEDALPIVLPRLEERVEDIGAWAELFVDEQSERLSTPRRMMTAGFVECLMLGRWPQNLRGLRGTVGQALLQANGPLTAETLPASIREAREKARAEAPQTLPVAPNRASNRPEHADRPLERATIVEALSKTAGNVAASAKSLGVERTKLYRVCKTLGIKPADYRESDTSEP